MTEPKTMASLRIRPAIVTDDLQRTGSGPANTSIRRVVAVFRHRPLALAGAVWIGLVVLVALLASVVAPYSPTHQDLSRIFAGPSLRHLLGTDELGRDTLSRLIYASRVALPVSGIGVGVAVGVGVPIGLVIGYVGGVWDWLGMRVVDALLPLPHLIVAIAVIGALGPSLTHAMVTLGLLAAVGFVRLTRGVVLAAREELYVDAARVTGESTTRLLFFEIFPNVAGPLVVQTALAFAAMFLGEAGLSFIGLGTQPPQASWGSLLANARSYIGHDAFLAVPPGVALLVTVLAIQLIGDALRDALVRGRSASLAPPGPSSVPVASPANGAADRSLPLAGLPDAVLSVEHLMVSLSGRTRPVPIVDDVTFRLGRAETLGLVGETGCGKSMTALSIIGLLPPTVTVTGGRVLLHGEDLISLSDKKMDAVRGNRIGMVFQDPSGSLDPAFTIGNQLSEPLRRHRGLSRRDAWREAITLLDRVKVPRAEQRVHDYPHQLSGGQIQRVMIAAALACEPDVLIADEPTTALDVTVQGQILDLLVDLRSEFGLSVLFVTHDLAVVADICDRVAVMYAGQIVEASPVDHLFARPAHPYTDALLHTLPGSGGERLAQIPGQVPPPERWPRERCRFVDRCPHAAGVCASAMPSLVTVGHSQTRCVRAEQLVEVHQ